MVAILSRIEILIKGEMAMHDVGARKALRIMLLDVSTRNKCNPRALDPLDTNSRGIIQIIKPPIPFLANETTLRTESQTCCFSESNVFATRMAIWNNSEAIAEGIVVVSTLLLESILDYSFVPTIAEGIRQNRLEQTIEANFNCIQYLFFIFLSS